MSRGHESFLSRWARRKRASATLAPVTPAAAQPAPDLPPLESLSYESDFGAFVRAKVDQGIKRAALKKLFSDPRFNVMDGLDVYIDDYSVENPIPPGMLAELQHARSTLFGPQTGTEEKLLDDPELAERSPEVTAVEPPEEGGPSQ